MNLSKIIVFSCLIAKSESVSLHQIERFPLDENNRTIEHFLLYHGSSLCISTFDEIELGHRKSYRLNLQLANQFFDDTPSDCAVVCIEKGTPQAALFYPLPYHIHSNILNEENPLTWVDNHCQRVETGFVNFADHDAIIYWINDEGEREEREFLKTGGESNIVWIHSYLGHHFEVEDTETKELLGSVTIKENGFHIFGKPTALPNNPDMDVDEAVMDDFTNQWEYKNQIQRTFSNLGFQKGQLPLDIFGSMSAYYYNNRHRLVPEEFELDDYCVNWWQTNVYKYITPKDLENYWQNRLKPLVEAWVGFDLEATSIYGMRRYEEGARLLTHVDRQSTHACSLIINVAQGEMREPWKVEIYDFADRLHEVEMEPGDIVYYESARCLHGRMQPLQGSFYVNLFAHYRPKLPSGEGDPDWFKKPNPPEVPTQVLDIGTCSAVSQQVTGNGSRVECKGGEFETPETVSPFLETLKGPQDLFRYWKQTDLRGSHTFSERKFSFSEVEEEL